jgi:hypothetical protein
MTKELWFGPWQGKEIFLFSKVSMPTLGPAQLPARWEIGTLSLRITGQWGVRLATYLHLVPRLGMSGGVYQKDRCNTCLVTVL